jgi:hypothetical protein
LRLSIHGCHFVSASERDQRSYRAIDEIVSGIADRLGLTGTAGDRGIDRLSAGGSTVCLYESIGRLSDEELDQLIVLIPILCFGQRDATRLDTGESLMNRVAVDLGVGMRTWWRPDAGFLSVLRWEQIVPITVAVGAAEHLQGLHDRSKKDLIEVLAAYFDEQSDPEKPDGDRRAKEWLPGVMDFPATKTLNNAFKS